MRQKWSWVVLFYSYVSSAKSWTQLAGSSQPSWIGIGRRFTRSLPPKELSSSSTPSVITRRTSKRSLAKSENRLENEKRYSYYIYWKRSSVVLLLHWLRLIHTSNPYFVMVLLKIYVFTLKSRVSTRNVCHQKFIASDISIGILKIWLKYFHTRIEALVYTMVVKEEIMVLIGRVANQPWWLIDEHFSCFLTN